MKQQNNNVTNRPSVGEEVYIDLIEDMCAAKDVFFHPSRVARDAMNKDVKMLSLDHTVKDCINFMKLHRIRHAPIGDSPNEEGGRPYFVGVISERDVFRQTWPYAGQLDGKNADHKSLRKRLVQIVVRKPKCVSPETPIPDVISTMVDNKIDMVPVLSDADPVGIITTTDIIKCLFGVHAGIGWLFPKMREGRRLVDPVSASSPQTAVLLAWFSQTVQEIMTEQVVCLGLRNTVAKAIEVLRGKNFRHLPIVDGQGKLVGIVSDRDILWHLPPACKRPTSQSKPFHGDLFEVDPRIMLLELPLARIMTWDVTCILPSCTVCDAAKTLYEMRVNCLPVVDKEKKLCGIVTVTDIMRALLTIYGVPRKIHA